MANGLPQNVFNFEDFLETQPESVYQSFVSDPKAGMTSNMKRYYQNQFNQIQNEYIGKLAREMRQGNYLRSHSKISSVMKRLECLECLINLVGKSVAMNDSVGKALMQDQLIRRGHMHRISLLLAQGGLRTNGTN